MAKKSLGEVWIELLKEVLLEGVQTQDYRELFNKQVYFEDTIFQEKIIVESSLEENIREMRKVFFSEEENKFGHSYAKSLVGPYGHSGIEDIVVLLKEDCNSKRAILTFIPYGKGKVPCINFIHFLVRENFLRIHYFSRGQDIYNKFACDAICIMDMAKQVADALCISIKGITANISTAHIYEEDIDKIKILVGDTNE